MPEIVASPVVKEVLREVFRTYQPYCWRRSYSRGIARPLHACPDKAPDQSGLVCYPTCRDGFNGVGPVCWQQCDNITSFGFVCLDLQVSQRSCPWYDKCGVVKSACVSCPTNYTKLGCLCARAYFRQSYGRGVGAPLECSDSYERDGAVCYKRCEENYGGIGPVCWQSCPTSQPFPCFAGCSQTQQTCRRDIFKMAQSVIAASITILNTFIGVPAMSLKTFDIISNADHGEWMDVVETIASIAGTLTTKILPAIQNIFSSWSADTLESATRNASFIITATAMKNHPVIVPLLKFFRLDAIDAAFNHGKCNLD